MTTTSPIDVCVCTYRRPGLRETLQSLSAQILPDGVRMRVVVADNDDVPSAASMVRDCADIFGIDCVYVHAPMRNISIARNAALAAATAPLVAFIDDDEVATPHWLAELLARRQATGAMIVFGPVSAVYGPGPAWLAQADLHSIRPVFRHGGAIETGYTCNVLMHLSAMTEAMRAVRFDPDLGRSGGEDTFFFGRLHALGATMAFAERALVHEAVTPQRAQLSWLVKRSFRSGQSHARMLRAAGGRRLPLFVAASIKCGCCVLACGAAMFSPPRWRRLAVRGALHAGVAARTSGLADLQLY